MKKLLSLLLSLGLILGLTACGGNTEKPENVEKDYASILNNLNDEGINATGIFTFDENKEFNGYVTEETLPYAEVAYYLTDALGAYATELNPSFEYDSMLYGDVDFEVREELGYEAEEEKVFNEVITRFTKKLAEEANVELAEDKVAELTEQAKEEAKTAYTEGQKQYAAMAMEVLALTPADLDDFAASLSLMNVQAFIVGVFDPAEGQEAKVLQAVEDYKALMQKNFEHYLADQKEVADAAIIETLESGEIVIVMSENASELFETIKAEIAK